MVDVLVIGAGLSGLMAAYTARKAGLSVALAAKGLGSLHWAAGTIDVLGYLPGETGGAVKRPLETLPTLLQHNPTHPYGLLSDEQIAQAVAQMLTRVGIVTKVEAMPANVFFTRSGKLEFSFMLVGRPRW